MLLFAKPTMSTAILGRRLSLSAMAAIAVIRTNGMITFEMREFLGMLGFLPPPDPRTANRRRLLAKVLICKLIDSAHSATRRLIV